MWTKPAPKLVTFHPRTLKYIYLGVFYKNNIFFPNFIGVRLIFLLLAEKSIFLQNASEPRERSYVLGICKQIRCSLKIYSESLVHQRWICSYRHVLYGNRSPCLTLECHLAKSINVPFYIQCSATFIYEE